ncbi:MAG TPA: HEAT repeat domain-containing protein [Candidatus Bathyarchaeia archaeon]|nr:HEAT repeat domain-containing protein [Candidatus Bathyarchaeia archaeon]
MSEINWKEKIEALIDQLKSSNVEVRQDAAWNLNQFAEDKIKEVELAIPALKSTIDDDDWVVRKMSILALGELNVKEEIPRIINFLRTDIDPEVRVGAALALGQLNAEEAISDLIKALDSSYDMLRQVSIHALGKFGIKAKAAVPKIIEILFEPEDTNIVQINDLAAWVLEEIGDKSAIEPLKKALNEAAYHERKFTIACALATLEGKEGVGFAELQRMKDSYELEDYELETFEKILEKLS